MKKLLTALGVAALLAAGCASQDNDNGMGGTSDQDTMKTDSIHSTGNGGSQNNNSDTSVTPSSADTQNGTSMPQ